MILTIERNIPNKNKYHHNYRPYNDYREYMHNVKVGHSNVENYYANNALMRIKHQPVQRLFEKPLIASPEAAMSSECIECDERGMSCMVVR